MTAISPGTRRCAMGLLRSGNETAEDSRRSGVGSGLSGREDELPQAVLCYVAVEATRMSGEGTLPRPRGTDMGVLARRCLCENLRRQSESLGFLGADGRLHGGKTPFRSAVYTMLQDEDGSLWLGCKPGGLLHLSPRADGSYDISRIALVIRGREKEHHVYSMQKDRWGRLWVSTLNHGLFCFTRTGKSWRCQPIVLSHDDKTGKYLGCE